MMTTRKTAQAKAKSAPTPSPAPATPELGTMLAPVMPYITREDGSLDTTKVIGAVKSNLSEKQFEQFEGELAMAFAPDGVIDCYATTWNAGVYGKIHSGLAALGTVAAFILVAEALGAVTGWEGARLATKLASWFLS